MLTVLSVRLDPNVLQTHESLSPVLLKSLLPICLGAVFMDMWAYDAQRTGKLTMTSD